MPPLALAIGGTPIIQDTKRFPLLYIKNLTYTFNSIVLTSGLTDLSIRAGGAGLGGYIMGLSYLLFCFSFWRGLYSFEAEISSILRFSNL